MEVKCEEVSQSSPHKEAMLPKKRKSKKSIQHSEKKSNSKLIERMSLYEKVITKMIESIVPASDEEKGLDSKQINLPIGKKKAVKLKRMDGKKKENKPKPIVADGNFVFSKFDLIQSNTNFSEDKKASKVRKLKSRLKNLQKDDAKTSKLVEAGKTDLASQLVDKKAWKNCLEKAEGKKVFDDPNKISKSLKRIQKVKRKHAKDWSKRKSQVEDRMAKRQEKREYNIKKHIEQKHKHKRNKNRKGK